MTPDVYILAGQFMMRSASRVATNTATSTTATGDVLVGVTDATLLDGSQIRTGTAGANRGGNILLSATGTVSIDGSASAGGGGGPGGGGPGGVAVAGVAAGVAAAQRRAPRPGSSRTSPRRPRGAAARSTSRPRS